MDAQTQGLVLGLGLVAFSIIAAIVVHQVLSGSSTFSRLARTVEIPIDKLNRDFHKKDFVRRLEELGFKPVDDQGGFVQGGRDLTDFGAGSHARTKKVFTLGFRDSGAGKTVALLTLRYLDFVAVDTGETAYRDAVLDYVSGKTDKMAVVPTESLLALNSLVGGILACIVAVVLMLSDQLGLWTAIPTLGVTEIGAGLLAVYSIGQKPAEILGRWKAVAGIALAAAAICLSLLFIIAKHSGPTT